MAGITRATEFLAKQRELTKNIEKRLLQKMGPKVITGPAERADQFIPSAAKETVKEVSKGLKQKIGGLFQKAFDNFATYVNRLGEFYNMK